MAWIKTIHNKTTKNKYTNRDKWTMNLQIISQLKKFFV